MKRKWCVREGVFDRDDGLWWLSNNRPDAGERAKTPMTVALRNGEISRVIDVKLGGLSSQGNGRGIF